ncbi:hypothetical protein FQA45_00220 [Glutamicibacter halophytocola]|uniref:Uncharacterized protein n=1 Tax=Glutamicibacter halophytocola TaxID=1933880 RepID=A0ABX5Y421_9MICC|nr:hypothetical protein [Glutamicibacter halophytocola]QDY64859.1 hypothetical protein FQA45_00220 [Glutamicibacter halophytocola]
MSQQNRSNDETPLNLDALEAGAKALLAVQQPEVSADYAWNVQFEDGRDELRSEARAAVSAYLAVAQPVVNSVEAIPAQVQVISWEEDPEHECWKLGPDETFVGLIVKSGRSWSPADKYTLHVERPAVNDA